MRVLVTGAGGFLGRAILRHWSGRHELIGISGRAEFDAWNPESTAVDLIVHAGCTVRFSRDEAVLRGNLASVAKVAAAVRSGVARRLIFLSAAGALGVGTHPRARTERELGATDPGFEAYRDTAYIRSKIEAEPLLIGLPCQTLYLTTVFGPGMEAGTRDAFRGRVIPPGGTSYLGLADFLSALDIAAERGESGRFVVSGGNASYRELFRVAEQGRWRLRLPMVAGFLRGMLPPVAATAFGYKYYDMSDFIRRFAWLPRQSFAAAYRASYEQEEA